MLMQFIGESGSLRLEHGAIYDVRIKTKNDNIMVVIPKFEFRHMVCGTWRCLYSSPQTLAANWRKPQ